MTPPTVDPGRNADTRDPIAEARILARQLETSSRAEVAAACGHSQNWVKETVALLDLTDDEQAQISAGTMSKAAGLRLLKQRAAPPHPSRGEHLDDLAEMLAENLDELVKVYARKGAEHGVGPGLIRNWLTNTDLLSYAELTELYGVKLDTLYQWTLDGLFPKPDVDKGTRVRLWNRNRAILYGWQTGKLQPGTLEPRRGRSPGRPKKT